MLFLHFLAILKLLIPLHRAPVALTSSSFHAPIPFIQSTNLSAWSLETGPLSFIPKSRYHSSIFLFPVFAWRSLNLIRMTFSEGVQYSWTTRQAYFDYHRPETWHPSLISKAIRFWYKDHHLGLCTCLWLHWLQSILLSNLCNPVQLGLTQLLDFLSSVRDS